MVWNENNPLLLDEDKWKERIQSLQEGTHSEQWDESTRNDHLLEESIEHISIVGDTITNIDEEENEAFTLLEEVVSRDEVVTVHDEITDEESNSHKLSKRLSSLGWSMVKMVCFIYGAQIVIATIVSFINEELFYESWFQLALAFVSTILIGYPLYIRSVKKVEEAPKQAIRKLSAKQFISTLIISTAIVYISNMIGTLLLFIVSLFQKKELYSPVEEVISNSSVWIKILYVVIVGPIMEEVVFRKYLLNRLKVYGDMPAILLSGIAFGLFHMNFTQFFYATTLGCFFAYIAIRTNTIRYVVLLHILVNLNGGLIAPFVQSLGNNIIQYIYLVINLLMVVTGICYLNKYKDKIYLVKGNVRFKFWNYIKPKGVCTYLGISIIIMILSQFL